MSNRDWATQLSYAMERAKVDTYYRSVIARHTRHGRWGAVEQAKVQWDRTLLKVRAKHRLLGADVGDRGAY